MAAYITGISMLILFVFQFGETRKVKQSGEFKIQKDFVPPPGNLIQRMKSVAWLKGIRPHGKWVQEEVEKSLDANNPHGILISRKVISKQVLLQKTTLFRVGGEVSLVLLISVERSQHF